MMPRTSDLSRPMPNATVATTSRSSPHMKLFWTRRRSDADKPAWYDSACHFSGLRIFFLARRRNAVQQDRDVESKCGRLQTIGSSKCFQTDGKGVKDTNHWAFTQIFLPLS